MPDGGQYNQQSMGCRAREQQTPDSQHITRIFQTLPNGFDGSRENQPHQAGHPWWTYSFDGHLRQGKSLMDSKDKKSHGEELVARLLTPQEADSVAGGEFTTYAQSGGGYCKFDQKSGGYDQVCPTRPSN
jgi:hypothetical protein